MAAQKPPALLARMATEPDCAAVAAALSPCGCFAASSTSECTTLLAVSEAAGEGTGAVAAVRVQQQLPPACSLCFLGSAHKEKNPFGECWLLLGCMDGSLRCLHVDVNCEGSLAAPVTVSLPEEDTLRQTASLHRSDAPASASIVH